MPKTTRSNWRWRSSAQAGSRATGRGSSFHKSPDLGEAQPLNIMAIRSQTEARAFLAHPILGPRYRQAVEVISEWAGKRDAVAILGPVVAVKLRSSLTLFEAVSGDPLFARAIEAFFDGPDTATLRLLKQA